jgi:hypothetical protein
VLWRCNFSIPSVMAMTMLLASVRLFVLMVGGAGLLNLRHHLGFRERPGSRQSLYTYYW